MKIISKFMDAVSWRINRLRGSKFDGWLRIYPTLRCNLRCPYCSNYVEDKFQANEYIELSYDKWIYIIKKINRNVIISGGEPSIYPGFADLLANIPSHLKVKVYSNMTFKPELIIDNVTRPISFLGSYHSSCRKPEKVMDCVKKLSRNPLFSGNLHIIETKDNAEILRSYREVFKTLPWNLSVDKDQRDMFEKTSHKNVRHVLCKNKIILLAPDGQRYPCMTRMLMKSGGLENALESPINSVFTNVECDNWGACSYCDGLINSKVKFLD